MAVTNAVESIYKCINISYAKSSQDMPLIMKFLNKIPFFYLMFIACAPLNIQLRIFYPSLVSKLTHKILWTLTNGRGDKLANNFFGIMMGFDKL